MTIGERIKAARKLRGVSYEELAKKTKIPADVLMYIEENNYSLYPQTIVLFCDTLNVSADYLLGRVDDIEIMPLPKRLTAENGAKKTLIGEFFEDIEVQCHECFGCGCDEWGDICEKCEGAGSFTEKVDVTWTTIKAIWKAAVAHFENETNAKPPDFKS